MKRIQKDKTGCLLFFGALFLCWLFVLQYGIFGSDVDWLNQHSVIPDYFRQRFYATGDLFPDMAWNLGGGQNIYNFSYYGLFNPVILFSWLLPFVKMDRYIMISSMLSYACSSVLFYQWIRRRGLDKKICQAAALMFTLAAPLLYHSYNQLMFVNYMPFLCLALSGLDDYAEKQKKGLFMIGVCGMILTSFYFSIGGIAALMLYGAERLEKKVFKLAGPVLTSVCLCGILLVPTACVIFSGDRAAGEHQKLSWFSFVPLRFFYSPYGIGLSALAVIALLAGVFCAGKWQEKIIPGGLLLIFFVPVCGYLLNGGLYAKDKAFIPFLPLVCLVTAEYVQKSKEKFRKKDWKQKLLFFLPYGLTILLIYSARKDEIFQKYWYEALFDCLLMLFCGLLYKKHSKIPWQPAAACVILFISGWAVNRGADHMVTKETYETLVESDAQKAMKEILDKDTGWYRMEELEGGRQELAGINRVRDIRQNVTSIYASAYNTEYRKFRNNTFGLNEHFRNCMMQAGTDNPVFLKLMGVRYLAGNEKPAGYHLFEKTQKDRIYKNTEAAPLGYVTDKIMGEDKYRSLPFPQNQTALLQKAVAAGNREPEPEETEAKEPEAMKACRTEIPELHTENAEIQKIPKGWSLEIKKETKLSVLLQDVQEKDDLLALAFRIKNRKPNQDVYIRLFKQTNRLTAENHEYANHNQVFSYMTTLKKKQKEAVLTLGPGSYELYDLKAYTGQLAVLSDSKLYEYPLITDKKTGQADILSGKTESPKGGYLVTSIPFDKSFRVWIDNKEVKTKKVNTAFLGAEIPAGKHHIRIDYEAPGKQAGMWFSAAGMVILALEYGWRRRPSSRMELVPAGGFVL